LETAAHLRSWAAMKAANSAGVPGTAAAPSLVMLACISGARRPSLMAALSRAMMASGVPAGAATPLKVVTS
jgi:hypothetical protein